MKYEVRMADVMMSDGCREERGNWKLGIEGWVEKKKGIRNKGLGMRMLEGEMCPNGKVGS